MALAEVLEFIKDEEIKLKKLRKDSELEIKRRFKKLNRAQATLEVLADFNPTKVLYSLRGVYNKPGDPIKFNHSPPLVVSAYPKSLTIEYSGEIVFSLSTRTASRVYNELSGKLEEEKSRSISLA